MHENWTRWVAPLASLAALGCDPRLPVPQGDSGGALDGGAGGPSDALVVSTEPPAPLGEAPRVLRLHAALPGMTFDPGRMALLKGQLGVRQMGELVRGKVSAALEKRLIPALTWGEEGGEALAPLAPLDPGALYTLVMADVPAAQEVTIAALPDTVPLLMRAWPPAGGSGTAALAIWCADGDQAPSVDAAIVPAPAGLPGRIRKGAVAGAGARCLRFEADPGAGDGGPVGPAVPPPVVAPDGEMAAAVRLDPRPLQVDGAVPPVEAAACLPDEVSFGPGCATVADDRLYGRSTGAPLLWTVVGSGTDTVLVTGPGDPFLIVGLTPASPITLDVVTVDAQGTLARSPFMATTLPPRPHVVINEVLSYPLGPSPAQEWVELLNDGRAPAELGGYVLHAGSGTTPLPAASLAPGAFALVVGQDYVPTDGVDEPPAPGTLILSVPHLGKRGLSHAGVALALLDGDGQTISSFPAKPKPKQGSSVARRSPSAPDTLPGSFATATPTPGRINTF
jgi:hypothetical protein